MTKKTLASEDARALAVEELEQVQGGAGVLRVEATSTLAIAEFADGWCGNELRPIKIPGLGVGGLGKGPIPIPNGQGY